jgi:hypothetical protein
MPYDVISKTMFYKTSKAEYIHSIEAYSTNNFMNLVYNILEKNDDF